MGLVSGFARRRGAAKRSGKMIRQNDPAPGVRAEGSFHGGLNLRGATCAHRTVTQTHWHRSADREPACAAIAEGFNKLDLDKQGEKGEKKIPIDG